MAENPEASSEFELREYRSGDETSVLALRHAFASPKASYPKNLAEWKLQYTENRCQHYVGTVAVDRKSNEIVAHAGIVPLKGSLRGKKAMLAIISLVIAPKNLRDRQVLDSQGRSHRLGYAALYESVARSDRECISAIISHTSMNPAYLAPMGFERIEWARKLHEIVFRPERIFYRYYQVLKSQSPKSRILKPCVALAALMLAYPMFLLKRMQRWMGIQKAFGIQVVRVTQMTSELDQLWTRIETRFQPMLTMDRSAEVFNWRFASPNYVKYLAQANGSPVAALVGRSVMNEGRLIIQVVDLLIDPEYPHALDALVNQIHTEFPELSAINWLSIPSHPYGRWLDNLFGRLSFLKTQSIIHFMIRGANSSNDRLIDPKEWFLGGLFFGAF